MSKAKAIRKATHPKARSRGGKTPAERFGRAVHLVREGNEALMELTKTGVQKPKRLGNVAMLQQMSAAQEVMNEGLNPAAGMSGAFGTGALMGALGGYYVSQHVNEQAEKKRKEKEESEERFEKRFAGLSAKMTTQQMNTMEQLHEKDMKYMELKSKSFAQEKAAEYKSQLQDKQHQYKQFETEAKRVQEALEKELTLAKKNHVKLKQNAKEAVQNLGDKARNAIQREKNLLRNQLRRTFLEQRQSDLQSWKAQYGKLQSLLQEQVKKNGKLKAEGRQIMNHQQAKIDGYKDRMKQLFPNPNGHNQDWYNKKINDPAFLEKPLKEVIDIRRNYHLLVNRYKNGNQSHDKSFEIAVTMSDVIMVPLMKAFKVYNTKEGYNKLRDKVKEMIAKNRKK